MSYTLLERLRLFEDNQMALDDSYGAEVLHNAQVRIKELGEEKRDLARRCLPYLSSYLFAITGFVEENIDDEDKGGYEGLKKLITELERIAEK